MAHIHVEVGEEFKDSVKKKSVEKKVSIKSVVIKLLSKWLKEK